MTQPGRNDACPCGSGRKFKHCCAGKPATKGMPAPPRMSHGEVPYAFQRACALFDGGQLAEAEEVLSQVLAVAPQHPEALHLGGLIAYMLGRAEDGARRMAKSARLQPGNPLVHNNLGLALEASGKPAEAVISYRQALRLDSRFAEAQANLGNALLALGQVEDAEASYRRALELAPASYAAFNGLGNVLQRKGQLLAAIEAYRQAIAYKPDHYRAMCNLAITLNQNGELAVAEQYLRQAISLCAEYAPAYSQLGDLLVRLRRPEEAEDCLRRSIALDQHFVGGHINLVKLLMQLGRTDEALSALRQAITLCPGDPSIFSSYLTALQYDAGVSPAELLAEHQAYARRFEQPLRKQRVPVARRKQVERLRIGLVSGDLREHPVGYFLEGVLEQLRGGTIDVVLYPTNWEEDTLSERLRGQGWAWHPLVGLADEQAAGRIRGDGIDILVDLSGHTAGNRLPLFALKPAPVQVSWLGYWATTGLQSIDYVLADPWSLPESERDQFTEKPVYLPETRLCFTPPGEDVPVGLLPARASGAVTFGSFNTLSKLSDEVVALWAEVLHAVPSSRLLCKALQLEWAVARERLLARFAQHGIAPDRLLLQGPSSRQEYLSTYHQVDIVLDPFPFTGATTSVEGLWMGVPVLTLQGDRMVAHQGESLLHNLDLTDWIARDRAHYVALAAAKAADLDALAVLRQGLRARLLASPLCDAARFSRHLSDALWRIWRGEET